MKIEIKDKTKRELFKREMISLVKKHNIYPLMEIDLIKRKGEIVYYENDKLTQKERYGSI